MGIEKVGVVFNKYCQNYKMLKMLLPLGMPILTIMAVLQAVHQLGSLGSIAGTVVYICYIMGILLVFAEAQYRCLAFGMGIHSLGYVMVFIRSLVQLHQFNWSAMIYLLVWSFFAYMAYRKSIQLSMN